MNPDYIYDPNVFIKQPLLPNRNIVFVKNEIIEERIRKNNEKFAHVKHLGIAYYSSMNLDGNTSPEDEEDIAYMRYKELYEPKEYKPNNSFMISLSNDNYNKNNGFMIPLE